MGTFIGGVLVGGFFRCKRIGIELAGAWLASVWIFGELKGLKFS